MSGALLYKDVGLFAEFFILFFYLFFIFLQNSKGFTLQLRTIANVNLPEATCPRPLFGENKAFISFSLLSFFAFSLLHAINFRNVFLFPASGSLIHVHLFE